jgi:FMN-dependent NADH-azoreductase
MNNILVIKTSLNTDQSQSNQLADKLAIALSSDNTTVTERDLVKQPIDHLNQAEMNAWRTAVEERSDAQRALANVSDELIEEIQASDAVVIGMPLYNFGVPSTFKAWIDKVARAGVTFQYTENGPVGLLQGKKVFVIATRGGIYKDTVKDTQTQYLKNVLAFLGMVDVQFIYAEGLNMQGSEERLQTAIDEIDGLNT